MIRKLGVVLGDSFNPYRNLALEQILLEAVDSETCILYLWQNKHTVVIGRNQNAWTECRLEELAQEGGFLARRLSGGGAVYHDLGNLNFTFLLQKRNYDVTRQLQVILEACKPFHIPAELSGRNDVLSDGRKFSGNAFYAHGEQAYHHGTLLVDVDMGALGKFLNPSVKKLAAKGVSSVHSRVINLKEICPALTLADLRDSMISAFEAVYGLPAIPMEIENTRRLAELTEKNSHWEWICGSQLPFTCFCEERFAWGELRLELQIKGGIVSEVRVYSDGMDWEFTPILESALKNCRFTLADLREGISKSTCAPPIKEDILRLLQEQLLINDTAKGEE